MKQLTDADLDKFLRQPNLLRDLDRADCEDSFMFFVRKAWPQVDPAPFADNWHLQAMAEHLQAVGHGEIRKLIINVPPRHSKTILTSVMFPAWIWAQRVKTTLRGPQVKFMTLTYGDQLSMDTATTARRLIESEWYQSMWGDRVKITRDQSGKGKFDTTAGGTRISSSFNGAHLGRGADIRIIDDPVKVDDANSDVMLDRVLRTYDEALTTRVTDAATTATIIIMQRLNEKDLAGHVLAKDPEFVHLCLPMRYDATRHCVTVLDWEDPRQDDGQLLWPEKFDEKTTREWERSLGPYATSGQLQQIPTPRGGGIFKREWWKLWPPQGEEFGEDGKPAKPLDFPNMEYIIASLDTAMTIKEENDFSALSIWGVWFENKNPKIMLMSCWQERLPFFKLVEKVVKTCRARQIDTLLVEAKNNGFSVAQEIVRMCGAEEWNTILEPVKGDKVARAYAVQHFVSNGLVFAPERSWADMMMDQAASFPKGAHDDLVDTMTQSLAYVRRTGLLQTTEESQAEQYRAAVWTGQDDEPLYDV